MGGFSLLLDLESKTGNEHALPNWKIDFSNWYLFWYFFALDSKELLILWSRVKLSSKEIVFTQYSFFYIKWNLGFRIWILLPVRLLIAVPNAQYTVDKKGLFKAGLSNPWPS